jgi:hypothetical protein
MIKIPKLVKVALLIIAVGGGYLAYQYRGYETEWQSALSVVERERLFEIIRDNSHDLSKERDFTDILAGIEIKFLRPLGSPKLAVINFNTKTLCGIAGCLYAVYQIDKPDKPLFQWLLDPALPSSIPLFATSGNCLVVNQFRQVKQQQISIKYCSSGNSYVERDKSYIDSASR